MKFIKNMFHGNMFKIHEKKIDGKYFKIFGKIANLKFKQMDFDVICYKNGTMKHV